MNIHERIEELSQIGRMMMDQSIEKQEQRIFDAIKLVSDWMIADGMTVSLINISI